MPEFYYAYILESETIPGSFYVGYTENLTQRLAKHNRREVPHTAKFVPWHIKSAVAFRSQEKAMAFERYLKTGSGRAFAKKRL